MNQSGRGARNVQARADRGVRLPSVHGDFAFSVPSSPRWNRNGLERFQGAYGNGGQRLWVFPGMDLVVAVTAGNYDTPDQWVPPLRVLREAVLASVV